MNVHDLENGLKGILAWILGRNAGRCHGKKGKFTASKNRSLPMTGLEKVAWGEGSFCTASQLAPAQVRITTTF
jgi:hypothetical protein